MAVKMIQVNDLVTVFRTVLGWPYASPGYNNSRGIDCSGAFVYSYKKFGESIYHGSNRIVRVHCRNVQRVTSLSQLQVGMAIFKGREDVSKMSSAYRPGGRYYNPELPMDYYHIGLVTSVSPLEIVNATTPKARIDNVLSKWWCAGYLNAVSYGSGGTDGSPDSGSPDPSTPPCPPCPGTGDGTPGALPALPFQAKVTAQRGSTVNLRRSASKGDAVLLRVPIGSAVTVTELTNTTWWCIRYGSTTGFMMREFLAPVSA